MVRMRVARGVTAGVVAGLFAAMALAGCESTADGSGGTGDGIKSGATIEEYKAAFADVSPIKLNTQSPSPKGSVTGRNVEEYLQAITTWSDGKITFEIAYSNAIAPPAEIDNALVDGRLDIGQVLPIYEPSEYPANAALIEAGFISDQSAVVGTLQSNAWPNEVAFNTPKILKEYDDHGMVPLVPIYNSGANALFCKKERTDLGGLKGMQAAAGGTAQGKQVKALGGTAASVPYTELFESLQRGVVDCTTASLTVAVLGGFIAAAPHTVVDPEAGFALAPGSMAVSKATWERLPLVARQLLWDRLDVFLGVNISGKIWPNTAEAAKQVKKAGGSIKTFGPDARKAIQDANNTMLQDLRGTKALDGNQFVDGALAAAKKWTETVKQLGYKDEVGYNDFDTWYADGKVDLAKYTDKLFTDIFAAHRPS